MGTYLDVKMIVTDLDRTLLRSDKSISDYTAGVLHACQQRGMTVVFATARSENSCKQFIDMIRPDAVISNGGALVRTGGKIIYRAVMMRETANQLLLSCLSQPNIGYITVDTDKGYFVNKPVNEQDPGWVEYLPAYRRDFSLGLDCDAYKITVEIFDNTTAYAITSAFPTIAVIPFSGENWIRIADKKADKWHGLNALAAHMGIDPKNIAAFGDDHSDIEMMRRCGAGVAVANAIPEVKAVAGYVCDTNDDDGVARWLAETVGYMEGI